VSAPYDNPFRTAPGSAPPVLVGRDGELSAARYAIGLTESRGAAQPIVFTGLRGMGKTALLRRCVAEAEARRGVVLYSEASRDNALATSLRRSLEHAKTRFASIPRKMKTALDSAIRALPEATYEFPGELGGVKLAPPSLAPRRESFVEALESLNAEVRRDGRFLVIAIDEVQEGHAKDLLILIEFVHLTAGTDEPTLFLGAGLPNSPGHLHKVRTYTERWRFFRIGLLSRDETIEAVEVPAKEQGVTFEAAALERVVHEAAGYPFFIQEYASAAWLQHRGKRVTAKDVEAVAPGVRRILEDSFYDERFRRLTPRECRYTLTMTALGAGPHTVAEIAARLGTSSESLSSIRNQLIKKDVVYVPSPGLVEFRMPLTDRYVQRHREALTRRAALASPIVKAAT
jgi:AAA ATPase-like protein